MYCNEEKKGKKEACHLLLELTVLVLQKKFFFFFFGGLYKVVTLEFVKLGMSSCARASCFFFFFLNLRNFHRTHHRLSVKRIRG